MFKFEQKLNDHTIKTVKWYTEVTIWQGHNCFRHKESRLNIRFSFLIFLSLFSFYFSAFLFYLLTFHLLILYLFPSYSSVSDFSSSALSPHYIRLYYSSLCFNLISSSSATIQSVLSTSVSVEPLYKSKIYNQSMISVLLRGVSYCLELCKILTLALNSRVNCIIILTFS